MPSGKTIFQVAAATAVAMLGLNVLAGTNPTARKFIRGGALSSVGNGGNQQAV